MSPGTLTILAVGAGVAAVGAGVSVYGSQTSAANQRAAAGANNRLSKLQAQATAEVARYQAKLNYETAMAQSAVEHQNAQILHKSARLTERQGNEQIGRMALADKAQESATTAGYASSGVDAGSGSALVVQGYNASMGQLSRLDGLYQTNIAASDKDWQGSMAEYQSKMDAETAKQFQYAQDMANWNEMMGLSSADLQQQVANNNADATAVQGIASGISQIGSAFNSYGQMRYMAAGRTANVGKIGAGGATTQTS